MLSCPSGCSWMWLRALQSWTYSTKCWEVKPTCCRSMSLIHALLRISSLSDLFLFFEIQKIFCARSWGLGPCSQALHQKDVLLPSPTVIEVAAANRSQSVVSHGVSGLFSILPSSSHSFHSHLRRSALANFPR